MTSVAEGPLSGQLPPDITHQANGRFGRIVRVAGLVGFASERRTVVSKGYLWCLPWPRTNMKYTAQPTTDTAKMTQRNE